MGIILLSPKDALGTNGLFVLPKSVVVALFVLLFQDQAGYNAWECVYSPLEQHPALGV